LCRFHYVTLNVGLHPLARSSRPSFKGDALAASCPCGLRSPHPNHAAVCCRMRFGHSSLRATAARGSTLIERQPAVRLPVDAYPFQAADPRSYHSRCRARLAVDRSGFAGGQKRACFLAASVGVFTLRPDPVQPHVWVYLPPGLGLCLPTSAGRLSCSPLAFAKGVPPTSWRTTSALKCLPHWCAPDWRASTLSILPCPGASRSRSRVRITDAGRQALAKRDGTRVRITEARKGAESPKRRPPA